VKARFDVIVLEEAEDFIAKLDDATRRKIIYNMDKSRYVQDPKLFKKLTNDVWEFRTKYQNKQYRFFAFWDKRDKTETLVISTHGIIKKVSKVPKPEIEKAEGIMKRYFND
jgi:phage-related protein